MAMHEKDIEAGTPIYAPKSSPKVDNLQYDRPTVEVGVSLWWLMLASMPRMAVQMAWTAQAIAFGPVGVSEFTSRLLNVSGPIVSLLLGPVIGVLSDRCMHKWGRRRPFLLFGAVLSAVLLFATCCTDDIGRTLDPSGTATCIIAVFFYVCMIASICAVEIPATLLIVDLAGDRQVTGAALGQGWSFLGAIVAMLYVKLFGDISSHGSFVAVLVVLMLVVTAIVVWAVRETPRMPEETTQGPIFATISSEMRPLSTPLLVYSSMVVLMQYGMATYNHSRTMFFEINVEKNSSDYYGYGGGSSLGDIDHFLAQLAGAYIFTWTLPHLANKFGVQRIVTALLIPVALLTVMAFSGSTTLVGVIDFITAVSRGTVFVFIVPVIIHVYGTTTNLGARVGVFYCIGNIGQLLAEVIGGEIASSSLGFQLPVLVGGITAIVCIVISVVALKLRFKSL